jgi:hypothetical protein
MLPDPVEQGEVSLGNHAGLQRLSAASAAGGQGKMARIARL